MGSFKLKLVVYFVLLALVPLGAAFWGFATVLSRGETQRVDARLESSLRAAVTSYQDEVLAAGRQATKLARNDNFQHALASGDRDALARALQGIPNAHVLVGRDEAASRAGQLAAQRVASVVGGGRLLGAVVISVPLDQALLQRLRHRAGLDAEDTLVAVYRGRVAVGPAPLLGRVFPVGPGHAAVGRIGDTRYRMLATMPLPEPAHAEIAVLSRQETIDQANSAANRRLGAILLAALALIAALAYFLSRSIVRTLGDFVRGAKAIARGRLHERVPVRGRDEFAELGDAFNEMAEQLELRLTELERERGRLRAATLRFAELLTATHDLDHLRWMIVETAVEATGAKGGELRSDYDRLTVGDPAFEGDRVEVELAAGRSAFGTLVLVGESFGDDERELASMLATQGVVALENARLHAIVERQASRDALTGLSNRRRSHQILREELRRAERLGNPFALVFADLDDFKAINDRYGHPTGDLVLREFSETVLQTVREIDHVARWGGEEFAILLPGADTEGAEHLAERLRAALEGRPIFAESGQMLQVTASFGVASFPDEPSERQLIAAADAALYAAKRAGKNQVACARAPLAPAAAGAAA